MTVNGECSRNGVLVMATSLSSVWGGDIVILAGPHLQAESLFHN